MYKIIICEDHDVVVEGVRLMLAGQSSYGLCGRARDEDETFALLKSEKPALVLLDLNLKSEDGFTILKKIKTDYPDVKVLILTMYEEIFLIEKAEKLKANGYLLKTTQADELLEALNFIISSEEFYLPKKLKGQIANTLAYRDEFVEKMHLSAREVQIIKSIVQGMTAKEIAEQLFLSTHTVITHRKNILSKLKLKNLADLIRFAYENRLV